MSGVAEARRTEVADAAAASAAAAPPVLISLSSFGAAEVRRHGQAWFAQLAAAAGADGIEVRGELLVDADAELPAIAAAATRHGLRRVYSSADGLWCGPDGRLDLEALDRALDAASTLRAPQLKMSIGCFAAPSIATLPALRERLRATTIELVIENDQTAAAGTLPALQRFFALAHRHDLPLGMTFDMGNWHWTGECPLQTAAVLAPRVRYVHCKGVQRQPQRWVAVPLADSAAPWRSVLRALPNDVPWAIEYPLVGDELLAVTRREIDQLRHVARSLA
jgi:sugar phosphate isomerase/epimerase